MKRRPTRLVLGLVGVQLADAAFNAVALYDIAPSTRWGTWAKEWAKEDLDRLRFPQRLRFVFPIVKAGSAGGLLLGLRWPRLGRLTAMALIAYFIAALGFHRRAKDPLVTTSPAALMLVWSALALDANGHSVRPWATSTRPASSSSWVTRRWASGRWGDTSPSFSTGSWSTTS